MLENIKLHQERSMVNYNQNSQ